jgi:hypothetical protein
LAPAQFEDRYNSLKNTHRLLGISAYNTTNGIRYADIWEKVNSPMPFVVKPDVPLGQVNAIINQYESQSYVPMRIEGFERNRSPHFALLFVKPLHGCQFEVDRQLTSAQYQAKFNQNADRLPLIHVDAYTVDGNVRYAAIWWSQPGRPVKANHAAHWYTFQRKFNNNTCAGYDVDNFYAADLPDVPGAHFGAIWTYAGAPNINPTSALSARLLEHAQCAPGRAGVATLNLTSGENTFANADQVYGTSSTIKSAIL